MSSEDTRHNVLRFFENIEQYYGCKTEIVQGLYSRTENFDPNFTTWNLSEFILVRSAYRKNGDRLMMEGDSMYYEIAAAGLIDFKHPGRHRYEFVEQYADFVYRITKVTFQSKY